MAYLDRRMSEMIECDIFNMSQNDIETFLYVEQFVLYFFLNSVILYLVILFKFKVF